MFKVDLIKKIAKDAGMNQTQVTKVVDGLINSIKEVVLTGEKVTITGFATFDKAHRIARKGTNPKTGAIIEIAAKDLVSCKLAKKYKEIV